LADYTRAIPCQSLSRFDPALEFRATGKGEGVQERPTVEIYRLREGVDLTLGLSFGTQALEGRCVGPDVAGIQPDLIIRYDQHLGHTQSGSQLGQQTAEVSTGGGFGKVGPEEKAEMLTGDGLQTGGQVEKQGANLATGNGEDTVETLRSWWPQQVDPQVCIFEPDGGFSHGSATQGTPSTPPT
jgi:hypothetical protein